MCTRYEQMSFNQRQNWYLQRKELRIKSSIGTLNKKQLNLENILAGNKICYRLQNVNS